MSPLRLPILFTFLSGMAALVYEIIWMRLFTPVFGLSIYSTTAVLCAFMGGLGLGSAAAPRVIKRFGIRIWQLYAGLEVGIGASCLLIPYTVASFSIPSRLPTSPMSWSARTVTASSISTTGVERRPRCSNRTT